MEVSERPTWLLSQTGSKLQLSLESEANTKRLLAQMGATPAWDKWLGRNKPHRVICKAGHECWPYPGNIMSGRGPCRICSGKDPATVEANVKRILGELGATPAWDKWLGRNKPHKVICKAGHECWPQPASIQQGHGPCRICAGVDPATAEANVKRILAELGATPAWDKWLGTKRPHRVICKAGHECWPRPDSIRQGNGPCRICAGVDPATAEANVKRILGELGAIPAWDKWRGVHEPHKAICKGGHECWPKPHDIQQGDGICRICAGLDSATAEANVKRILAELGATPAWDKWLGTKWPHRVICKAGHECYPYPTNIQKGVGPCGECAGQVHDVLYVVTDGETLIKFGITSNGGHARLTKHKRDGLSSVLFLATAVDARPVESAILRALRIAGWQAEKRREYFSIRSLPLVMKVIADAGYVNEILEAA